MNKPEPRLMTSEEKVEILRSIKATGKAPCPDDSTQFVVHSGKDKAGTTIYYVRCGVCGIYEMIE